MSVTANVDTTGINLVIDRPLGSVAGGLYGKVVVEGSAEVPLHVFVFHLTGGPLGELVQWSDLISVLYILGHQLTITSEVEQLVK